MTVIAYRDGVLAADSLSLQGSLRVGIVSKIVVAMDGSLGAASGVASGCEAFRAWFDTWNGNQSRVLNLGTGYGDWAALIIRPDLSVWNLSSDLTWHPYQNLPFFADGEGTARCIAMGAMEAGASAARAVEAAIKHSIHVGGPVCWRRIEEPKF